MKKLLTRLMFWIMERYNYLRPGEWCYTCGALRPDHPRIENCRNRFHQLEIPELP